MWRALPEKNLLTFLRKYAISDLFHSSDRIKYHSSFDRSLIMHNQMQHGNHEIYQGWGGVNPLYTVWEEEQIPPFSPIHNVFGHQIPLHIRLTTHWAPQIPFARPQDDARREDQQR